MWFWKGSYSTGRNKGIMILNMVKNYLRYLLSKVHSHSLLGFNTEWNDTEWSIPPHKNQNIPTFWLLKIPEAATDHAVDLSLGNIQIILSLLKIVNVKGKQHSSGAMLNEDYGYKIHCHSTSCTTQHHCYYWLITSTA
jgi:hypothetical protein